jgi:hypothetical protein
VGIPLPFRGEFEIVIMIERVTEEMHGSNWVSDLKRLRADLGWYGKSKSNSKSKSFHESEMARSWECTEQYAQKVLDTAGIVRDAMLRQQSAQPLAQREFDCNPTNDPLERAVCNKTRLRPDP